MSAEVIIRKTTKIFGVPASWPEYFTFGKGLTYSTSRLSSKSIETTARVKNEPEIHSTSDAFVLRPTLELRKKNLFKANEPEKVMTTTMEVGDKYIDKGRFPGILARVYKRVK